MSDRRDGVVYACCPKALTDRLTRAIIMVQYGGGTERV
jgi:hypothetical protein